MGYVKFNREADTHPETLFEYVIRPDQLSNWLTLLSHLGTADDRLDHVGASFTGDLKIAGRTLTTRWVVEDVKANNRILFHGSADGGGEAKLWYRFSDWDNRTNMLVELEYELPGRFLTLIGNGTLAEKMISRDLRRSVAQLVGICERQTQMSS